MSPQNVLIVGNSHTAAARIALRDGGERWLDFAPEVFAMPGNTIAKLDLRDRVWRPQNDDVRKPMQFYNGVPELPLAHYDAFVVMGCLAFGPMANFQETHRSLSFPSVAAGHACGLISDAMVDAMMRRHIRNSPALRVIRQLAGLGQGPVLFLDTVFPSVETVADPQRFVAHVEMAARGDGPAYHARYVRLLLAELGRDATWLPQPAHTVVDHVFTASEWMRGSIQINPRSDTPHEAAEYEHANPAYGALQIDAITQALAS